MVAASVVLPTYRRFRELLDTLESLLAQSERDIEVIVVDQNDVWPDEHCERRSRLEADGRVRWLTAPPGVVNARHAAVERSQGEILIFVDDDVAIADGNFIAAHLANYRDPSIDAVVGRELEVSGAPQAFGPVELRAVMQLPLADQPAAFPRDSAIRTEICSFCTCNASVRRSAFMRVGGFDEGFAGVSYGDDYDFAIRLGEAGGRIVFDPKCALVHLRAPIGGLRLSDRTNAATEHDRALSGMIFYRRYGRGRPHVFYHWVLRRTVLLRSNITAPWRLPAVVGGLFRAWRDAGGVVRAGPRSRFT